MFSIRKRPKDYIPLLGKVQLEPGDSESSSDLAAPLDEEQRKPRTVPSWILPVVLACTLLNVMLSILPTLLSQDAPDQVITRQNIHLLRRPNQYIGLDEIPRPSPPIPRQLTAYPILLSLVDAASPDVVFDDDVAMHMVHAGTITPDDRKVRVTQTMSTIVQFRAIDWGMETCELHVNLPESNHSGSLALYRINSTVPLDTFSLSYNTRPHRIARLGIIALGLGVVPWHRKFSCAMDEVLSFELACLPSSESGGDSDCFMEWIQIKDALPAIYMVQHSTI